jgi:hypothetical protein
MPYDSGKRGGWAKGLVHFHTDFSDGRASIKRAAEIAVKRGYDFLVITDHLQDLKLKTKRRFEDYVAECDAVSESGDILVLPGGEFEDKWQDGIDKSEGHTLTLSVRPLVDNGELLNADPMAKPYAHWADSAGSIGGTLAIQEKLRSYDLPILASHQFQHSLVSYEEETENPDFRYDLRHINSIRALDFFYSGLVDVAHEVDDFALYLQLLTKGLEPPPCVYASCDYHIGPEVWFQDEDEGLVQWTRTIASLAVALAKRNVPIGPGVTIQAYAAPEQLGHATYVWLGAAPLTEANILQAFRQGRTFVTRGEAEVEELSPPPGTDQIYEGYPAFRLRMSKSYESPRPRVVFILRDGKVVHRQAFHPRVQLDFSWPDWEPGPGRHHYILYVPTKLITSPILVEAP